MGYKIENNMNKKAQETNKTDRHRQPYGGFQRRGSGRREKMVKGVKYMAMEEDLTLASGTLCNIQTMYCRIVHLKSI